MATNPPKETIAQKGNAEEDKSLDYEIQIAKLDEEYTSMLRQITADNEKL